MSSLDTSTPSHLESGRRPDRAPSRPRPTSSSRRDSSHSGASRHSYQSSSKRNSADVTPSRPARRPERTQIAPRTPFNTAASRSSTYSTTPAVHTIVKPYSGLGLPADQLEALVRELDKATPSAVARSAGTLEAKPTTVPLATLTDSTSAVTAPGMSADEVEASTAWGADLDPRPNSVSTTATLAISNSAFPRTKSTSPYRDDGDLLSPPPAHARLLTSPHWSPDAKEKAFWSDSVRSSGVNEPLPDLEAQARAVELRLADDRPSNKRSRRLSPAICCMQYIVPLLVLGIFAVVILVIVKYR